MFSHPFNNIPMDFGNPTHGALCIGPWEMCRRMLQDRRVVLHLSDLFGDLNRSGHTVSLQEVLGS